MVKLVIFDLDGVITETSEQHYEAWKTLGDELGIEIDRTFNEQLKGVSRRDSLLKILELSSDSKAYSEQELLKLMNRKNEHYRELISRFDESNISQGVEALFDFLIQKGIKIAIGSASRNAPLLLNKMKLIDKVDYVVDPSKLEGKPSPAIFLDAAYELAVEPKHCIGIEDAIAGVEAIKAAGMFAVGIGDESVLKHSDVIYKDVESIEYSLF